MNKNIAAETYENYAKVEEEPVYLSKTKLEETSSKHGITPSKGKLLSKELDIFETGIRSFKETIKEELSSDVIKQINRQISKKIPLERKLELIQIYNVLADKQFNEGLSKSEERQLIYIRWQIDRIDDAETGEGLDRLEQFTEGAEIFANELSRLIKKFDPTKKRPGPFKGK